MPTNRLGRSPRGWLRRLTVLSLAVFGLAAAAQDLESLIVDRAVGPDGQEIVGIKTLPIPVRPAGFATNVVKTYPKTAKTLATPSFDWTYGCSATSAGMMFGYYDRNGYPDFYTGPVDGGVCPLTNEIWGKSTYGTTTCGNCPIVATKQGVDARATKGHVDDYWYATDSAVDPYYTGSWTQHSPLDCAGDFMGTNQYRNYGNVDGATTFYWNPNGDPLYDYDPASGRDGCHGMRLFVESCGYTVPANGNYNQYIYGYEGNTKGFTFAQYMDEIDANRPVLIQVEGHTMLGVGYDDASNKVYLHDTWDYLVHEMTWGGSYSGMAHYGVTVFQLASSSSGLSVTPNSLTPSAVVGSSPANGSFSLSATSGSIAYTITDNVDWLSCSPSSGTATTTAQTITVAYSASTLAVGIHTAVITVSGGGENREVTVALTITSGGGGTFSVSPSTLEPTSTVGSSPANDSFSLSATSGSIAYTITDNVDWLSCSPSSGTTTTVQTITVAYSASTLAVGIHTAVITVSGGGQTQEVTVTLTISGATDFTVTIGTPFEFTSPVDSAKKPTVYVVNGKKKISAKVTGFDSSTRVVSCQWTAKIAAGTYTLEAKVGKLTGTVSSNFVVAPPVIYNIEDKENSTRTLVGEYFGFAKPTVCFEYYKPGKTKPSKLKCSIGKDAYSTSEVTFKYNAKALEKIKALGVDITISIENKISKDYYAYDY